MKKKLLMEYKTEMKKSITTDDKKNYVIRTIYAF